MEKSPFFPLVTPKCAAKFHNNSFPNIIIAPLVFVTVDSMLFLRSMVCGVINISCMKKGEYIFRMFYKNARAYQSFLVIIRIENTDLYRMYHFIIR